MKVLVCAGGTGGGIYPALAAIAELRRQGLPGEHVLWIGTRGEMEEVLVPKANIRLETIAGGAIVGVGPRKMFVNAAKLTWSLGRSSRLIRRFKPDVMLMTGGYVAVPVALSAWLQRIPIAIFLPDIEPGRAIQSLIRFATAVACTSEDSRDYLPEAKMYVTGYPVRLELRAATGLSQAEALSQFDLAPGRPTLFVFGGSRGARRINQALMLGLPALLGWTQIIHISGNLTWPEVEANAHTLPPALRDYYRPFPYLHERMGAAFRAADLAVARAGASMMGECPAFGLPSILVPLTWAWRYQKVNADYLTSRGAAIQLRDESLATELIPAITNLLGDREKLAQMAQAASSLDVSDATGKLAAVLTRLSQLKRSGAAE